MHFTDHDLALLESILRDFSAESGTLHEIRDDGALHLRVAIGIPDPVLDIVKFVPIGKGMAGIAAERKCAVNSCNIQHDATGDVRPLARTTGLACAFQCSPQTVASSARLVSRPTQSAHSQPRKSTA
jgi:hypothetical protein